MFIRCLLLLILVVNCAYPRAIPPVVVDEDQVSVLGHLMLEEDKSDFEVIFMQRFLLEYPGPRLAQEDLDSQRSLERAGWLDTEEGSSSSYAELPQEFGCINPLWSLLAAAATEVEGALDNLDEQVGRWLNDDGQEKEKQD